MAGSFKRFGIGSWFNVVCGIYLTGRGLRMAYQGNLGIWMVLLLGVGIWLLIAALREFRAVAPEPAPPNDPAEDEEEEPLRSLVLLLEAPRSIRDLRWAGHLGAALGVEIKTDDDQATEFLIPMPHPLVRKEDDSCFMLRIPQGIFWILHVSGPYWEEVEQLAAKIGDRRQRELVEAHRAWLSIDLLSWTAEEQGRQVVYQTIGKAIAALAGPDVLAIYAPELNRLNEWDPMLIDPLRGEDPLGIFQNPTFAPVLQARSDDEQMEAAIEEARRRWPEFVGLFGSRIPTNDKPFLVKAPFSEGGKTEHMWLTVTEISDHTIRGLLANHPHHLISFHEGQMVTVDADSLSDWLCLDGRGQPLGGWTQKVLAAAKV